MQQLRNGRDTFEFDHRHVTKNKPITELIYKQSDKTLLEILIMCCFIGPVHFVKFVIAIHIEFTSITLKPLCVASGYGKMTPSLSVHQ